ncbi:hypothetical protein VTN31DRAFT_4529 [Thermomyces dupontii]|uniref:uncharacterized protein n=1 Tax=Talaromyces thermophilus TaxID=28565 RepID=UPI0037447FDF
MKTRFHMLKVKDGSHGGINASLMYLGSAIAEGQILQHVESVYGRLSSTLATGVSAFQTARCRFIDPAHLFYPRVSKEHRRRGARSRRNWRHFSLLESGSKNEASGSVVRQFGLFCRGWKTGGLDGAWYILCTLRCTSEILSDSKRAVTLPVLIGILKRSAVYILFRTCRLSSELCNVRVLSVQSRTTSKRTRQGPE